MSELKPCPFCGGEATFSCMGVHLVRCASGVKPHCPASFGGVSVDTWNRRAPVEPVEREIEPAWVERDLGDPLPMQALYIVTNVHGYLDVVSAEHFDKWGEHVIAYLPTPLPAPFASRAGEKHE